MSVRCCESIVGDWGECGRVSVTLSPDEQEFSEELVLRCKNAVALAVAFDSQVVPESKKVAGGRRDRVALACLLIASSHARSLIVLGQRQEYLSAYALLRPLREALIKYCWLLRCASDDQLIDYIEDRLNKGLKGMLSDIREHSEVEAEFLEWPETIRTYLNGFTHAGRDLGTRALADFFREEVVYDSKKAVVRLGFLMLTRILTLAIPLFSDTGPLCPVHIYLDVQVKNLEWIMSDAAFSQ